ncbi:MAG: peptidase M14, partial [Bacteroidota bacterium]
AALLDIFKFLGAADEKYADLRELLRTNLTLTFLPMLNPDGAQRFTRRNALGVDLNRDALRLQSPESRILKEERDRLQAEWGFNLHDQSIYYGVGFPAEQVAAISILAPAFDWEKTVNAQREDAMQLIGLMNRYWQVAAPEKIGRYNDDFEPRAFGDNLQKWGTRTILIESGGWPGDREKQYIRQLNFVSLLSALHSIAT